MSTNELPQKDAEQIIRMFNVGFNSALLYGGAHPTTLKNIEPFTAQIMKSLDQTPIISLIIDRESLFLDDVCADRIINPKRIISQFTKTKIVSVSFERGITQQSIQEFLKLAGDMNLNYNAEQIESHFKASGLQGLRLNHVRYGKITSDETLISRDAASRLDQSQQVNRQPEVDQQTLDEIKKVISLAKTLDRPKESAQTLAQTIIYDKTGDASVSSIEAMRREVHDADAQSVDMLLNAVLELKVNLSEALEAHTLTGKILTAAEPAQKEMDKLTCDVLARLIREEYSKGSISTKRLAQIVRRMLPDLSELKRVLPMLKNMLIEDGMSLADYLLLVRSIDMEVENDSISELISDAASGIGASTDDVVNAIKANPAEAAKLMFLASEIHNGINQDDVQLSTVLCEYVEKVSSSIALESKEIQGHQGNKALGKIITHVESQLVDKLKSYGIDEPVLLRIKQMLEQRYQQTCSDATAMWVAENIPIDKEHEIQNLAERLNAFLGQEQSIQKISEPLIASLQAKGYNQEQIAAFVQQLSKYIDSKKKFSVPAEILSANNMLFMLNREIKQHIRYNTPFSTLLISIMTIRKPSSSKPERPSPDALQELTTQLFSFVKSALRDIDLIGSLNNKDGVILAILTMTNLDGANVVVHRMKSALCSTGFSLHGETVYIDPVISITIPEKEVTKDLNSYLDVAKNNHKKQFDT
ncbi:MAG: hypothetical protein GX639_03115 [Fibrobacter sp.]|nr:hypothetical protein [Fibrobacter sp.]